MTDLLRDAVGILGIGPGAGATMFSALDGVLLRPLPYADPDRLVVAWEAGGGAAAGVAGAGGLRSQGGAVRRDSWGDRSTTG